MTYGLSIARPGHLPVLERGCMAFQYRSRFNALFEYEAVENNCPPGDSALIHSQVSTTSCHTCSALCSKRINFQRMHGMGVGDELRRGSWEVASRRRKREVRRFVEELIARRCQDVDSQPSLLEIWILLCSLGFLMIVFSFIFFLLLCRRLQSFLALRKREKCNREP